MTINTAKRLLIEGKVFWSALQGVMLTGRLATLFNVPAPAAFLVKTVAQGSSAWNMGLQGSDGTVTIGGQEIPVGGDIILAVDALLSYPRTTSSRSAIGWPRRGRALRSR